MPKRRTMWIAAIWPEKLAEWTASLVGLQL